MFLTSWSCPVYLSCPQVPVRFLIETPLMLKYDIFHKICHGRSINARGLRSKHSTCDFSAESSQSSGTTSSRMLQWQKIQWSGSDSIINIARARRLRMFDHVVRFSRAVPASNIISICCASGDGCPPTILGGAQVDDLELPGLIASFRHRHVFVTLRPIHFIWHKIVRSGGPSLWPQRLYAQRFFIFSYLFTYLLTYAYLTDCRPISINFVSS